jgi:hypothetical protein
MSGKGLDIEIVIVLPLTLIALKIVPEGCLEV